MEPTLRGYQEEDATALAPVRRSALFYEPRLGKTPTTIQRIVRRKQTIILIICPKNALYVWRNHILGRGGDPRFDPRDAEVRICHGTASDRHFEYSDSRTSEATWYVTTYGSFIRDQAVIQRFLPIPHVVVCDEAKRLRNRTSKAFEYIARYTKQPSIDVHFLEGTPTKRGPKDFWTMFNIIDRKRFGSYHTYVEHFYETTPGMFGGTELVQPRNLDSFHRLLREYSRIRYRADVRPEMPIVQRQLVPVDMDDEQRKLYAGLDLNGFVWADRDHLVVAPTSLELSIRLRQLLICPRVIDPTLGLGGAWDAFTEMLEDTETADERHVVVFCPFTKPFNHWQADLLRRGFQNVVQLHGGLSPRRQEEALAKAANNREPVLCSIRFAEAFSLAPAIASYFIGQEWDPNTNRQAEDRLIPQEGTNPIAAQYYAYNDTIELGIVEYLNAQQRVIDKTMGRKV